jgi:hypothetical protein
MHDIIKGFVSGKGYGWGGTTNEVHGSISATKERIQAADFKHSVGMASSVAGSKTFSIKDNSLSRPHSDVPMDNPNADSVTGPAHKIRERNRVEESGKGGIHTTSADLAKEMTGFKQGAPPRPTHDLYRNQSFYYEGNLVQPQENEGGIVLPSGKVIRGDETNPLPQNNKDFWKGSVFEKK